jgi:hypothetical protein
MRKAERQTRERLTTAIDEYVSESEHEGTKISLGDFTLYLMFGVLSDGELRSLMSSLPNVGLLKGRFVR